MILRDDDTPSEMSQLTSDESTFAATVSMSLSAAVPDRVLPELSSSKMSVPKMSPAVALTVSAVGSTAPFFLTMEICLKSPWYLTICWSMVLSVRLTV